MGDISAFTERCPHCGAIPAAAAGGSSQDGLDFRISNHDPLGDARFAPGHLFARRYRIVSLLGRGAMGEVYRADDLRLGQPIALKLLTLPLAREQHVQRLASEARLARDITHPNVCRVYDIGSADGWHYLSMEYVDGETLASLLRRIGRMPREKAMDIARQLCAGLTAAHDVGVLHRDIKPSNIMIDGRGRVRLMDFGLAVPTGGALTGDVVGTPAYMAPEQLAGDRATEQTDLYALGLVLHEVFTGRQIFPARSFDERIRFGYDTPLDTSPRELDPDIGSIIRACLARDPAARPASARALTHALPGADALTAAIAEGRLLSPDMIAAAGERGEIPPVRAWALVAVIVAGVLLVAARIGDPLQLRPSTIPKPPDALVENAREVLTAAGHTSAARDSEHWFTAEVETTESGPAPNARLRRLRFTFRQSPSYLVPQNLFRVVTAEDPSATIPGMASVSLDADGRLLDLVITPAMDDRAVPPPNWDGLFAAAGLSPSAFRAVAPDMVPLVPHDQQLTWQGQSDSSASTRINAATLRGRPVYFSVTAPGISTSFRTQGPISAGGPILVEATLWLAIVIAFIASGLMARHNYRRGEGDRRGARRLSVFIVVGGTMSAMLRGHHVPNGIDEASFLLVTTGWALAWGAFSWLIYMSIEPYARRLWPAILISWQRLLAGRLMDPMVARDVLLGMVVGVGIVSIRSLISEAAQNDLLILQLEALRSTRAFIAILLITILNAVQNSLAGLLFLLLVHTVVRRTWVAILIMAVLFLPFISGGTAFQSWTLAGYFLMAGFVHVMILMRVSFLASIISLHCQFMLLLAPLTLDTRAWYFGYSIVALLVIGALTLYGALVSSASQRPSPHPLRRELSAPTTV